MKKILLILTIIAMAVLIFAQKKPVPKTTDSKVIVDWEGKSAGMQVPEWVKAFYKEKSKLESELNIDTKKNLPFYMDYIFSSEEYASISKDWMKAEVIAKVINSISCMTAPVRTSPELTVSTTTSKLCGAYNFKCSAIGKKIDGSLTDNFWNEISKANLPSNYKYAVVKKIEDSDEKAVFKSAAEAKKFCEVSSGSKSIIDITAFNDDCFTNLSLFKKESFWIKRATLKPGVKSTPGKEPKSKDVESYEYIVYEIYTMPRAKYEEMLNKEFKRPQQESNAEEQLLRKLLESSF